MELSCPHSKSSESLLPRQKPCNSKSCLSPSVKPRQALDVSSAVQTPRINTCSSANPTPILINRNEIYERKLLQMMSQQKKNEQLITPSHNMGGNSGALPHSPVGERLKAGDRKGANYMLIAAICAATLSIFALVWSLCE